MILTNYRPVSASPMFSNIIERLVYDKLVSYINENYLLHKYQFGSIYPWSISLPPLHKDLSTVLESCFSILFADDTNMFITDKNIQYMCHTLNEDPVKIQELLCCNTFSLNVSKTRHMVFTP